MDDETAFKLWEHNYTDSAAAAAEPLWPSETLVRLFKGPYIPGLPRDYAGRNVIDVGCGNGNNLLFLGSLGLALFGTEVTTSICQLATRRLSEGGFDADIRQGTNRTIPFEDNSFDFLVSWNVIHYEGEESLLRNAIREYARVLKPEGRFFLSTAGPDHMIRENSESLGNNRYRITRSDDFRKGQVYLYLDTPEQIRDRFSAHFRDLLIGRSRHELFTGIQDCWIVTGQK